MFGTLSIFDTIGGRRAAANDYIGLYDPQTLYQQLTVFLEAHNRLMDEMMTDIAGSTQERFLTWGSNAEATMQDGDEFSRPDIQKITVNPTMMGFPLYLKQVGYGVTQLFMETKTVGDLEQVVTACTDADVRDRLASIRAALFKPTDNLTTHTHYLATAAFVNANLHTLIDTVIEHYASGTVRVYINRGLEATVRAFADFLQYYPQQITPAITSNQALGVKLDVLNIYNRPIGFFGSKAEVWVKPWVPTNYVFAFNTTVNKPLMVRTRPTAGTTNRGSLRIAAQNESYPLRATYLEREYGVGVYERTNGACLYTGGGSYVAPPAWSL